MESDEPVERIRDLVRLSEQSCFAMQSLVGPVPVETRVELNGKGLDVTEPATGQGTKPL